MMKVTLLVVALLVFKLHAGNVSECREDYCDGNQYRCSLKDTLRMVVQLTANNVDKYYGFCLAVDKLTQINIPNSHAFLYADSTFSGKITVHVGGKGTYLKSNPRFYTSEDGKVIVPFYTMNLAFEKGLFNQYNVTYKAPKAEPKAPFTAIPLEYNCDSEFRYCIYDSSKLCVRNWDCGFLGSDPDWGHNVNTTTADNKNVKIYVAFSGTDSSHLPFRSAGLLPSMLNDLTVSAIATKLHIGYTGL